MSAKDNDMNKWRNCFSLAVADLDIDIDERKIYLLERYIREIAVANQTFNLTNITDPLEIAENLMLDSIVPGKFIPSDARVLDLGTGAGFPGMPLKIVFPELSMTLIDSKRKKISFLKYVIRQLKLQGIEALQIRAEELAKKEGGQFDVVISKAVSAMPLLIRLTKPLLKEGGVLIAMKGRGYQSELEPGRLAEVIDINRIQINTEHYRLPHLQIDRTLVFVRFV